MLSSGTGIVGQSGGACINNSLFLLSKNSLPSPVVNFLDLPHPPLFPLFFVTFVNCRLLRAFFAGFKNAVFKINEP